MIVRLLRISLFLLMGLAMAASACAQQDASPDSAVKVADLRLRQGKFASVSDQASFERAASSLLGGEIRITNPTEVLGDGETEDLFGYSVAVAGDTAVIGAPGYDRFENANEGAAYVFTRIRGTTWRLAHKFVSAYPEERFGESVAIAGNIILIGASAGNAANGTVGGAVYVYYRNPVWSFQAKLTADDAAAGDQFGISVSIAGDTALIGAAGDDNAAGANAGSAYVFTQTGSTWVQEAKLAPGDAAAGDQFGSSVAIEGDTVLVGAAFDDHPAAADAGSAYAFTRIGSVWTQQAKLVALDAAAGDQFAASIALSSNTAVIGAPLSDGTTAMNIGSAYVFARDGVDWTLQSKITAQDSVSEAQFGASVSISSDKIAVGARFGASLSSADSGSAYTFMRSGNGWVQQVKLSPSSSESGGAMMADTLISENSGTVFVFTGSGSVWSQQAKIDTRDDEGGDQFGHSVAISGNTALVGAPWDRTSSGQYSGSGYVFVKNGGTWTLEAQLRPNDLATFDLFGYAVAIYGDTAVLTSPGADTPAGQTVGAAYVFTRSGSSWTQHAKLFASDGVRSDAFGRSVAIQNDTVVIGAPEDSSALFIDKIGSVYVFTRSGTSWSEQAKLLASDGRSDEQFGISVGLSGDAVIVGATGHDTASGFDAGAAYVFGRSSGQWTQRAKLTASDGTDRDGFGNAVAVSDGLAVVGARAARTPAGIGAGAAYVFGGSNWTQLSKLTASNGGDEEGFGSNVAISRNKIVVTAPTARTSIGNQTGGAYVFSVSGNRIKEQWIIRASNGDSGDQFGRAVALSEETSIIGASLVDSGVDFALHVGAAYVFDVGIFVDGFED
jgi:FG-GAP repeat